MSHPIKELKNIKVMIVDDHTLFAEGTRALLSGEPRISIVGIAKNGLECIDLTSKFVPDVVILDIQLPDINGTDLIEKLKKVQPEVKIIMMTGYSPKGYVKKSMSKGAQGFILKNCTGKEMIQAILRVYEGGIYFSDNLEAHLQLDNNKSSNLVKSESLDKSLTPKEVEIIELMAKGLHNKEIAEISGIKVSTVNYHISNILPKLEANTRFEAVLRWANKGKSC